MHRTGLFAPVHNLAKEVLGEPEEHRKVATVRRHMVLEVGHHNFAAEGIGPVEGRHTVLEEERRIALRIALVEERRIVLGEEHRMAAVDTAPEAGCMAAVEMGSVKEHHRAVEAEDSLEGAGQAADIPVVGHIQEPAKNRTLAVAGGIGHVAAADNLLNNSQYQGCLFRDRKKLTGCTAIRGIPWPTLRGRIRHEQGGKANTSRRFECKYRVEEAELSKYEDCSRRDRAFK